MKKKDGNNTTTNSSAPTNKPKKKKEATKSREWERDRRERLNNSFSDLSKLLPLEDDNAPPSKKIEILQRAFVYIKTLQQENTELLESGGLDKVWSREVKQLQCQVKELTNRIQQLATLIHEAGGKLPSWVSLPASKRVPPPLGKRQFLYSNRISQDSVTDKNIQEKFLEPKQKKSRKSSSSHKKTEASKEPNNRPNNKTSSKKKRPRAPSMKSEKLASNANKNVNKIKPTSVAQLLNIPASSTNGRIESVPSTSGVVMLPPEKPIDISPGILVLKGNTQPVVPSITASTNNLSSGLLIVRGPAQPTQASPLAPGTCILLPSKSSSSVHQTPPISVPLSTHQCPAQTTTLLTAPIMATGQPSSVLHSSLPSTSSATPTFVLTNGNLVPVLPTATVSHSNSPNPSLTIGSKPPKENKNCNKIAIPKLQKRNSKSNKSQAKQTKVIKGNTPAVDLEPMRSIIVPSDVKENAVIATSTSSEDKSEVSMSEKLSRETDNTNTFTSTSVTPITSCEELLPQAENIVKTSESSNKPSHKSSYSIDALCKGKHVSAVIDGGPKDAHNAEKPPRCGSEEGSKKEAQQSVTTRKGQIMEKEQEEKSKEQQDNVSVDKSLQIKVHRTFVEKRDKVYECTQQRNDYPNEKLQETSHSDPSETYTENIQVCNNSNARNYYNTYDSCNTIRNNDFVPAEISPSGFIGPQPPMATVVDAPIKENLDSYSTPQTYRSSDGEEPCRVVQELPTSDHAESEVLSTTMPSTFSSDLFASLSVPSGHPESISPTAAFLLAFPLVSSSTGRTNEVLSEPSEMQRTETCHNPGNSLLQLGSIDENQQTGSAVVELNSLMQPDRHHALAEHQTGHLIENNLNVSNFKSPSKVAQNTQLSNCRNKQQESISKQYTTETNIPQSFSMTDTVSDYDTEISSIMSNTNQHHQSPITNQAKQLPPRTTNSCRPKTNIEKCRGEVNHYIQSNVQNSSNISEKQFVPVPVQNEASVCPPPNLSESQQIMQQQESVYQSCNKKLLSQQLPYHQSTSNQYTSNAQQNTSNLRCNLTNYNQPIFSTSVANSVPNNHNRKTICTNLPTSEVCMQKHSSENTDTSHFIGKLNTNASSGKLDNNQKYKLPNTDSTKPQSAPGKNSVNENRFERQENSRLNLVPTSSVSNQAYACNIFNDYQTSNYLPLPPLSSVSSSTTDTTTSSFGSFSVAHNSSNFGILSWSTLSPMSAPNSQQLSNYNSNVDSSCQKQLYQLTNESHLESNQHRPSYQQVPNRAPQISYPPQTTKETSTPRPPVNWMTTPDIRHESIPPQNTFDHTHITCSNPNIKDTVGNSCNYTSNALYSDYSDSLGHSWPTGKTQNVAATNPLPTLVGDLALGPTPPSSSKYYSPGYKPVPARKQDKEKRGGEYGSSSSFLSVSQLVDHTAKESRSPASSRKAARPASKAGSKRDRNKIQNNQQTVNFNESSSNVPATYPSISNWPAPKPSYKATPSNYSAESLIGIHPSQQQDLIAPIMHDKSERYSQTYSARSHFPGESTNYFPDSLDPNYQQSSYSTSCTTNYQASANNYMPSMCQTFPGPELSTSSIPAPNFPSDLGSNNFLFPATTASMSSRPGFFSSEINTTNTTKSSNSRSIKRRHIEQSENYTENAYAPVSQLNTQDYISNSRNHPVSQQTPRGSDTASQNCTSTYHSAKASVGQTTTPPSQNISATGGGSSLTNFNLSAIFPDLNEKTPVPPLPAFVSSKNLSGTAPLLSGAGTDYMLHHSNMGFNNLLSHNTSHQVGIGLNQSFPTPSFSNMMPPSLPFTVHEH